MADANERRVRLIVAMARQPPGFTAWAQALTKACRSATCSTTSMASTMSKVSALATTASTVSLR